MPPKEHESFSYVLKHDAPTNKEDVDNPGKLLPFTFQPKHVKARDLNELTHDGHQLPCYAKVVPKD